MYVCMHACLCIYVSMYLCIYVSMYVCMYVSIGIYLSIYVCIYACIHACMHQMKRHQAEPANVCIYVCSMYRTSSGVRHVPPYKTEHHCMYSTVGYVEYLCMLMYVCMYETYLHVFIMRCVPMLGLVACKPQNANIT